MDGFKVEYEAVSKVMHDVKDSDPGLYTLTENQETMALSLKAKYKKHELCFWYVYGNRDVVITEDDNEVSVMGNRPDNLAFRITYNVNDWKKSVDARVREKKKNK